jgi:hypothetical protein
VQSEILGDAGERVGLHYPAQSLRGIPVNARCGSADDASRRRRDRCTSSGSRERTPQTAHHSGRLHDRPRRPGSRLCSRRGDRGRCPWYRGQCGCTQADQDREPRRPRRRCAKPAPQSTHSGTDVADRSAGRDCGRGSVRGPTRGKLYHAELCQSPMTARNRLPKSPALEDGNCARDTRRQRNPLSRGLRKSHGDIGY